MGGTSRGGVEQDLRRIFDFFEQSLVSQMISCLLSGVWPDPELGDLQQSGVAAKLVSCAEVSDGQPKSSAPPFVCGERDKFAVVIHIFVSSFALYQASKSARGSRSLALAAAAAAARFSGLLPWVEAHCGEGNKRVSVVQQRPPPSSQLARIFALRPCHKANNASKTPISQRG